MKMEVFWNVASCSLVEITDVSERFAALMKMTSVPDDEGSKV
jgi:hypothetical protein